MLALYFNELEKKVFTKRKNWHIYKDLEHVATEKNETRLKN